MEIMFMLIAISLIVAIVFLCFFLFGIKSGQFEDMHTPSVRILFENNLKTEKHLENGESGNDEISRG
jgi:cbb3-type cytochrome oxidase maturation protein